MTIRDLIEALHRLYTDPRVQPSTPVHVEMRVEETHYHYYHDDGDSTNNETEHHNDSLAICSVAIGGPTERAIILSALARPDAIAR